MDRLDSFLQKSNGKLTSNIYTSDLYLLFNFPNREIFEIVCGYLLRVNGIKIYTLKEKRLQQSEFRKELIALYGKCVVTGHPSIECEAAHIRPITDNGPYSVENGLLLTSSIHKTFDKFLWSINPLTNEIEINTNEVVGSIQYYNKKIIIIRCDLSYLVYHYIRFCEKLNVKIEKL